MAGAERLGRLDHDGCRAVRHVTGAFGDRHGKPPGQHRIEAFHGVGDPVARRQHFDGHRIAGNVIEQDVGEGVGIGLGGVKRARPPGHIGLFEQLRGQGRGVGCGGQGIGRGSRHRLGALHRHLPQGVHRRAMTGHGVRRKKQ